MVRCEYCNSEDSYIFPLEGNSNNANEINYPLSKHDDDGDEFVPSMVLFLC